MSSESSIAYAPTESPRAPTQNTSVDLVPGALFASRYRILSFLGKGGMGEVYHAEDLRLGQAVALKLLPSRFLQDLALIEQFHQEARLARQVTHPNVCRVYDIGEEQGRYYISMEHIDGETLSSLRARLGPLPQEKALDIAHQLCEGVAAAHAQGIIHRDLKPANVMLDSQGRVRVMDFGLALRAEEHSEDFAGTPAYMAPEQLSGRETTLRSDVYAVGIILYELFTGKRPFEGGLRTSEEERSRIVPPSLIQASLPSSLDALILSCLAVDPAARPANAREVGALLPAQDPIAALMAAGDTPAPQLLAGLRVHSTLTTKQRRGLWMLFLLMLSGLSAAHSTLGILQPSLLPLSPTALAEKARTILTTYGHTGEHTSYRLQIDGALRGQPNTPLRFWFRLSDSPLTPQRMFSEDHAIQMRYFFAPGRVSAEDPPPSPDSALIELNPDGTLLRLVASPATARRNSPLDWGELFLLAGLRAEEFQPTQIPGLPSAEETLAWRHVTSGVVVIAASAQGRPVYFEVRPSLIEDTQATRSSFLMPWVVMVLLVLAGTWWMARRNLRRGRGDTRAALQLARVVFTLSLLQWALTSGASLVQGGLDFLLLGLMYSLAISAFTWFLYIALEPAVRRRWPRTLLSWSRLMHGWPMDALVGRDLLLGALFGVLNASLQIGVLLVGSWFGGPEHPLVTGGLSGVPVSLLAYALFGLVVSPALLFLLQMFRRIVPRDWLAALMLIVLLGVLPALSAAPLRLLCSIINVSVGAIVVLRVGLLGGLLASLVASCCLFLPLSLTLPGWLLPSVLLTLTLVVTPALLGTWIMRKAERAPKPLGLRAEPRV